ncbi:MAG TPA: helix-turn-helix transcriptional regulator [Candidatus Acidoferrum sp.]|nr:helix-turn-helix transcriptional regulator [Candidatus Acidoferrum sp.]
MEETAGLDRKAKRIEGGWTQAEVSLNAKINPSKLSLFERGLVELTSAELKRLDKFLDKRKVQPEMIQLSVLVGDGSTVAEKSVTRKWARKATGLNQRQIAELVGIDQADFSRWESARKVLSKETVQRIFDIYESRTKSGSKADLLRQWGYSADYGDMMFGHVQRMQKELSLLRQAQKELLTQEREAADRRLAEERAGADRRMEEIAGSYQRSIGELEGILEARKKETTPKDGDD